MLTSPMDGSPQVVRFDETTLWHFDAAEWAPSTASFASGAAGTMQRPMSALLRKHTNTQTSGDVRLVPIGDMSRISGCKLEGSDLYIALAQLLTQTSVAMRGCNRLCHLAMAVPLADQLDF